jgi:hypothetical protein
MPTKTTQVVREWARWMDIKGMPVEDIAGMLEVPPAEVWDLLADRQDKPDDAVWPFRHQTPANAHNRKIRGWTATHCRRLAKLGYRPPRIAELLCLEERAVRSFIDRVRRLQGRRGDRLEPGEMIRPRTPAQERAHDRAVNRASKRRRKRELATPPPGWTYADRTEANRADVARLAAVQAAVRDGRLSTVAMLSLSAGLYFSGPRAEPPPPIVPATWSGASSWQSRGSAQRFDADALAELRALRSKGWSTGALAARYNTTRSNVCYALARPPARRRVNQEKGHPLASHRGTLKPHKVLHSGGLYMVVVGEAHSPEEEAKLPAVLVDDKDGIGETATFGGMMRHVSVVDPWQLVTDHASLPEIVRQAMR